MNNKCRYYACSLSFFIYISPLWIVDSKAVIKPVDLSTTEDRIVFLERLGKAHCQVLHAIQKQLIDNQDDINVLLGKIETNQYKLNKVVRENKIIRKQIDKLIQSSMAVKEVKQKLEAHKFYVASIDSSESDSFRNGEIDYHAAIALILEKKQYSQAMASLQSFIKKYPKSMYQSNAYYWLGQLFYIKGKKDDAAYYFSSVVKNYKRSEKVPDAMYKVGVIMQEKGLTKKANAVFHEVLKKYPRSAAASLVKNRIDD